MVDIKKRDLIKKGIVGAIAGVFAISALKSVLGGFVFKDTASGAEHRLGQNLDVEGTVQGTDLIVPTNGKVYLEGAGSDTYIIYDGSSVKLYHNNTLVVEWNST